MSMEVVKEMLGYDRYARYKQSGVDWLGEIPSAWNIRRLGMIGSFQKGGGISRSELVPEGLPAVLYGDIYTKYTIVTQTCVNRITPETAVKAFSMKRGDLLLTGSGETKEDIGKCVLYDGEEQAYAGGDVIVYRVIDQHPLFLSYVLNCSDVIGEKVKISKGEIIVHIYGSKLKDISIPLPPLPEQTRIAAFLDRKCGQIDAAIAQKERLIALLKERRQVLVQQAVTKGLDPQVKMKDSGVAWLGEVPAHWEVRRLGTLGAFGKGRELARGMTVPNGSPVILYGDLYTSFDVWTEQVVSFVGPDHAQMGTPITKGDLVLAASGETREDIGKCAAYMGDNEPRLGGDALCFSLKDSDPVYMSFLLNSPGVVTEKVKLCKGEIIVHIYPSMLKRIFLPVPPPDEQQAIGRWLIGKVENERSAIKAALDQIAKLKEYRSILINAAVTGKNKVPEE